MNLAKITGDYVYGHPSIKDSLKKGIINYSKLSRAIIAECSLKNKEFDAIVAALRRLSYKLKKKQAFERAIKDLLKASRLEIRTKIMVCVAEKSAHNNLLLELQKNIQKEGGELQAIEGIKAIILITSQQYEPIIDKYFHNSMLKKTKGLIEIFIRSPESLENIPGVMSYLCSLFSDSGINIIETMSCWTDTVFIISPKDLDKAVGLLSFEDNS